MGNTMYDAIPYMTWEKHHAHLAGNRDGTFGVISANPLNAEANHALLNSARKLGYGKNPCFFCSLRIANGQIAPADNAESEAAEACSVLSPSDLFEIIEGLDPISLVAADSEAVRALSEAYRTEVAPLARSRVLGRTTVAFRSFEAMLTASQDKQIAWALLKRLV